VTDHELNEIEERARMADPGPWKALFGDNAPGFLQHASDRTTVLLYDGNLKFIAAARTDVPVLVAEVRRLRAELARKGT
jgi:hypothetical protein